MRRPSSSSSKTASYEETLQGSANCESATHASSSDRVLSRPCAGSRERSCSRRRIRQRRIDPQHGELGNWCRPDAPTSRTDSTSLKQASPLLPINVLQTLRESDAADNRVLTHMRETAGSIGYLIEIVAAWREGEPWPVESMQKLEAGLHRYMTSDLKLEAAFRVDGRDRLPCRLATQRGHIRRAWQRCEGATDALRRSVFLDEARRLEERWGEFQGLGDPPSSWYQLRIHLWRARRIRKLPMTDRGLRACLAEIR